jgi:hypothetical protein
MVGILRGVLTYDGASSQPAHTTPNSTLSNYDNTGKVAMLGRTEDMQKVFRSRKRVTLDWRTNLR